MLMARTDTHDSQGVRLTIDTDDTAQRWRYRCPKGHTTWEPTNYHWWCQECALAHDPDVEPEKRRKLQWAERLLYGLEQRRGERFPVLDGRRGDVEPVGPPR
jgi:hypothetical protein